MGKTTGTNGLDIQRDYVCVAQFDPSDNSVRQIAIQPLTVSGGSDGYWDAVAGELRGLRKNIRFAGVDVICSLPCDMAVVKTLEAESDEADQQAVLRWELSVNLMGPLSEYAVDFYEVDPGHQADRRRYLAAAIRKETLAKLKKAVQGVKLNPYVVDIDLFALANVFQSNYRERLAGASILVHGEHARTKMMLVCNSSYVDYAVVDYDADSHTPQEYAAMLSAEAGSLVAHNRDIMQGGAAVYLAGALFTDRHYAKVVSEGVSQCELLDPFKKIVCATGMDNDQLKTYSPQLAVAIGLALRGEDGE